MHTFLLAVALASTPDEAATAVAPPAGSSSDMFLESMLIGTYQRTGAMADLRMRYRHALYASDDEAFKSNYWGAGFIEQASPVFSQTGAYVEVQPASFFRLTGAYELVGYFGTFDTLRTMSGCDGVSAMSATDTRCAFPDEGVAANGGRADYGHRAWVEALSQVQLGPLIVSNNFTAERWWFREDWAAGQSATHWVNELLALPQKKQDTVLTNTAMAMYEVLPDRGGSHLHLMAGVMSSLSYAVGTEYLTHRVGPTAVLHVPEWHGMRDLAAVLMVQWYTNDRYTKGPVPFVGLALSVSTRNFVPKALR